MRFDLHSGDGSVQFLLMSTVCSSGVNARQIARNGIGDHAENGRALACPTFTPSVGVVAFVWITMKTESFDERELRWGLKTALDLMTPEQIEIWASEVQHHLNPTFLSPDRQRIDFGDN